MLPLFKKVARRRLPPGCLLLSVVSFRALRLALALSVFFEQLGDLLAGLFVADSLLFRGLADNLANLFDERQADEHLRGRLEVADAPFDAAAFCVVAVQAVQRQPAVAAVLAAIVAVATKVAPENCFGVVRASQHGCLQRVEQGSGVLPNVPELFRKVRRGVVVGRPADVNVATAIVARRVNGVENALKGRLFAVKVGPGVDLVPLDLYGAILRSNQSIGCAQIGGLFLAVRGVALKLQGDGPSAARGLAGGFCGEGAALKVRGVVAVSAQADTTFMHVRDRLCWRVRLDAIARRAGILEKPDWLTAQLALDARAGFCSLENCIADGFDVNGFVLLHDILPSMCRPWGPCPVNLSRLQVYYIKT